MHKQVFQCLPDGTADFRQDAVYHSLDPTCCSKPPLQESSKSQPISQSTRALCWFAHQKRLFQVSRIVYQPLFVTIKNPTCLFGVSVGLSSFLRVVFALGMFPAFSCFHFRIILIILYVLVCEYVYMRVHTPTLKGMVLVVCTLMRDC